MECWTNAFINHASLPVARKGAAVVANEHNDGPTSGPQAAPSVRVAGAVPPSPPPPLLPLCCAPASASCDGGAAAALASAPSTTPPSSFSLSFFSAFLLLFSVSSSLDSTLDSLSAPSFATTDVASMAKALLKSVCREARSLGESTAASCILEKRFSTQADSPRLLPRRPEGSAKLKLKRSTGSHTFEREGELLEELVGETTADERLPADVKGRMPREE